MPGYTPPPPLTRHTPHCKCLPCMTGRIASDISIHRDRSWVTCSMLHSLRCHAVNSCACALRGDTNTASHVYTANDQAGVTHRGSACPWYTRPHSCRLRPCHMRRGLNKCLLLSRMLRNSDRNSSLDNCKHRRLACTGPCQSRYRSGCRIWRMCAHSNWPGRCTQSHWTLAAGADGHQVCW